MTEFLLTHPTATTTPTPNIQNCSWVELPKPKFIAYISRLQKCVEPDLNPKIAPKGKKNSAKDAQYVADSKTKR